MVCSIFMASITASGWPLVTASPAFTAGQMQAATTLVGQQRLGVLTTKLELKPALHHAMGVKTIAAAEGVHALAGALAQQGLSHGGSSRQGQAHGLLLEQHRLLARDQRGVQLGAGKCLGA